MPTDNTDAQSIAGSEEPEIDFRKKIKYGSRIQVRGFSNQVKILFFSNFNAFSKIIHIIGRLGCVR